jgi:hypothetical protein
VQPVRSETVWLVAGWTPAPEQKALATVLPSDCVQVTVRVSVATVEQVLESADQDPVLQLYVQLEVKSVDCVKAPSVPQLKLSLGVQA